MQQRHSGPGQFVGPAGHRLRHAGDRWAATVTLGYTGSADPYFAKIVHAIGGRQVKS